MAGRPILRQLKASIEAKGGDAWFFDQVVEGRNINAIAKDFGIGLRTFYGWIHATPERVEGWKEAKRLAAHTHADLAMETAEGSTNATSKADWLKIKMHQWLAEHYNREEYGQQPIVSIQNTINEIHLTALQASPEQLAEVRERLLRAPREIRQLAAAETADVLDG